jgi:hypothetical protein
VRLQQLDRVAMLGLAPVGPFRDLAVVSDKLAKRGS